jgi:HK97 family phage portal protein
MRLAVLYACVNVISQDLAKVPLVMYARQDDGGRKRVTNHPVVKLLQTPARGMTASTGSSACRRTSCCAATATARSAPTYRGQVRELAPLKPDNMRVEVLANDSLRYHYRQTRARASRRIFVEGEILHFRGLSLDGPLGMSPIDQAKETLGEAVAAQGYAATFFANDARPSLWLEHPGHFKDESQKKDWLSAFKRAFGGGNRFSPMLTEYGIKIHSLPPVDHAALQFLELRKLKATRSARSSACRRTRWRSSTARRTTTSSTRASST